MKNIPTKLLYVLMLSAMIVWGLSWTNGKILGTYADPQILMFWRFFISALVLLPVTIIFKNSLKIPRKSYLYLLAGAFFLALYNIFYFTGTKIGSAGAGGVLVTTMNPIFTFFLTFIFLRAKIYRKEFIGLAIGVIGGLIIINFWNLSLSVLIQTGLLYFILCAVVWALLTITTTKSREFMSTLTFSFWIYLIAALITIPFLRQNPLIIFDLDSIFWLNFISISLGAMTFGTTIYFVGAMYLGSEKASAFIFTVPLFAMGFAMIFLKEELKITTVIGGLLAMLSVYLINQKHRQQE
jgi:drug/metabolite transporter (DMT)-like permease